MLSQALIERTPAVHAVEATRKRMWVGVHREVWLNECFPEPCESWIIGTSRAARGTGQKCGGRVTPRTGLTRLHGLVGVPISNRAQIFTRARSILSVLSSSVVQEAAVIAAVTLVVQEIGAHSLRRPVMQADAGRGRGGCIAHQGSD